MRLAGLELTKPVRIAGGDVCAAYRASTDAGLPVFVKTLADAPRGFFAAEARGLEWLRVDGGPPLPRVLAVDDDALVLEWVAPASPGVAAAQELGRSLAAMHQSRPPHFGAAKDGFIASLPLPNTPEDDWPTFYAERRLLPYVDALPDDGRRLVDRLCARLPSLAGPAEPPARIHGDLWSGNLLWSAAGPTWLVDAASAHGGHRETDLAMLELFGTPHLDVLLASYDEVTPLAEGWRERLPLHRLHPLLVHAMLFGGGYVDRAISAARAALGQ